MGGSLAKGILRLEDIGEPARAIAEDIAARLAAVAESLARSPLLPAEEPYDESAVVSLRAIVAELDFLREDTALFLNVRTGEVEVIDDEFVAGEDRGDDDLPDHDADGDERDGGKQSADAEEKRSEPEWRVNAEARGRTLASDPDWLRLLTAGDLGDRDAMIRFARKAGLAASQELLDALHARRAESNFRQIVRRRRLEQEWETFRMEQLADTVKWHLRQSGIAFRK